MRVNGQLYENKLLQVLHLNQENGGGISLFQVIQEKQSDKKHRNEGKINENG